MDKFIAWAKENRRTSNGQLFEHVSFPSFVKNFRLTDRSGSLADYTKLIASSELGARRRQKLQSSHDSFTRNRLHSFWKSWTQQLLVDQAQQELNTSSAVTAKKTAVLAQKASLSESKKSFRALKMEKTVSLTSTAIVVGGEQHGTNKQPYESDTDVEIDGPYIASSPASKTHPFDRLVAYVFKTAQGRCATLPVSAPRNISGVMLEMYSEALKELKQPGPVIDKKDAFVLLSSIVNTVALSGRKFSISKKVLQGSRLLPLEPNSVDYKTIKAMLKDLSKTLHPASETSTKNYRGKPQFQSLKKRVWTLLSEAQEETTGGELVSKASTKARQKIERIYGATTSTACGRKVDLSIRIRFDDRWRHEVAVFEFKASTATQAVCEKQQKKSVRLNAAILHDLEAKGLDISKSYPIIAEGQALGLDFYTLRRYDDVLGAGRSTSKGISLPSHVDQLKAFFESEAILTLLAFKEHIRQYAYDVTDVLANSEPTPFSFDYDYREEAVVENASTSNLPSRSSTPPPRKRGLDAFVLFSPSKKSKLGVQEPAEGCNDNDDGDDEENDDTDDEDDEENDDTDDEDDEDDDDEDDEENEDDENYDEY
ncbi:hypothetical protein BGX20_003395 [Mortierella sp. AD010]|nr:hypothetical protein BGX20_003395 [Mortierella sp. AD010]